MTQFLRIVRRYMETSMEFFLQKCTSISQDAIYIYSISTLYIFMCVSVYKNVQYMFFEKYSYSEYMYIYTPHLHEKVTYYSRWTTIIRRLEEGLD